MATNTLVLTGAMSPRSQPLRGDMGVTFDFAPPDNWVQWFHTEDSNLFVFSSNSANFRRFNGATPGPTLTVGGAPDLFYKVMYDKTKNQFKVTATNQVGTGGGGGSGTQGPAGEAATISIGTVTSGPTPQVTNSGTITDAVLDFVLQQGPQGLQGEPGVDGATFPDGGNTGDLLARTGVNTVGWVAPPSSTGGTGTGRDLTEKIVTLNANKHIILSQAVGYNFFLQLDEDAVQFPEPTGYLDGDEINLVIKMGPTGGKRIQKYGTNFLLDEAQPPVLPTAAGAFCEFNLRRTNGGKWRTIVTPGKTSPNGFGLVTPISRVGTTEYYSMGEAYAAALTNQVIEVIRSGRGPESVGTVGSDSAGNPRVLTIAGRALADGSRPSLFVYPDTRLAFQKAIVNLESGANLVRDLIIDGSRNFDSTSRGIAINNASAVMRNLLVRNCENGTMWGNLSHNVEIYDSEFNNNGHISLSSEDGKTHNIYAGEGSGTLTVRRSSFLNCERGHDFKTRQARTIIDRCLVSGSKRGRALDCPNGGILEVTDTRFRKLSDANQGNLVSIGQEGINTGRTRQYVFRNCEFRIDITDAGRDVTFVWNADPDVDVVLIDCTFIGDLALANNNAQGTGLTTSQGLRGRVVKQFTTGVTPGPRYPVGYQAQTIGVNGAA